MQRDVRDRLVHRRQRVRPLKGLLCDVYERVASWDAGRPQERNLQVGLVGAHALPFRQRLRGRVALVLQRVDNIPADPRADAGGSRSDAVGLCSQLLAELHDRRVVGVAAGAWEHEWTQVELASTRRAELPTGHGK